MSAIQVLNKQETQTAVRVKSVRIEKLFEIFDYDIEYAQGENVLIITGPNGFGKTTILNVLYSLLNEKFQFFYKLIFDRIVVELSDGNSIEVIKTIQKNEVNELIFNYFNKNKLIESFDYLPIIKDIIRKIENDFEFIQIGNYTWVKRNPRSDRVFTIDDIVDEHIEYIDIDSYPHLLKTNRHTIVNVKGTRKK